MTNAERNFEPDEISIETAEKCWGSVFEVLKNPIETDDLKFQLASDLSILTEFLTDVEGTGGPQHASGTLEELTSGVYYQEFNEFIQTVNEFLREVTTISNFGEEIALNISPNFKYVFTFECDHNEVNIDGEINIDSRTYKKAAEDMKLRFEVLDAAVNP